MVVADEEDAAVTTETSNKRKRGRPFAGTARTKEKSVREIMPVASTSQTSSRAKRAINGNEATSSDKSVVPQDYNNSQTSRLTRKRARIENAATDANHSVVPQDDKVGKVIWVNTTMGTRKKKNHGWCEAVITEKNSNGIYIAKYKKCPKVHAEIEDLDDEECVRMVSPEEVQ